MEIIKQEVLIIGGGLAGMRAAIETSSQLDTAIIAKIHPARSHSGAAQGGIAASLGNSQADSWEEHMFDTVKGGDYLGDQDSIEILVKEAPENIYELEHMGAAFSRTKDGKIAQRPFGGHSNPRACYAADLTGHILLHTLYEQLIKRKIKIYNEYYLLSLILRNGIAAGIVVYDIKSGELVIFQSKAIVFATGGYGRAFKITSNAHTNTGDGLSIIYRAGLPLEDLEFVQFHPTGLYKQGILVTEGARGEGGYLLNKDAERFMQKYAPKMMEIAPRDIVARAIQTEIDDGRGIDGKDYVHLDLRHLGGEKILELLPQIHELALMFSGVDCIKKPIPIQPTAHYSMGGIPVDINCRVIKDKNNTIVPGLFAAGECACVSVHGANRLGCNSLLEAVVFGRRAGKTVLNFIKEFNFIDLPDNCLDLAKEEINTFLTPRGTEILADIRDDLQYTMTKNCGVFRKEEELRTALETIKKLKTRFGFVKITDKSKIYNTELLEAIELGHILDFAEVIVVGAILRKESRGGHFRKDFPRRDDENWLKHTLAYYSKDGPTFDYKAVKITKFQPQERKY
ncbi:MAG: succinate dehydrogenase flavoprotein subunit [Armatimonadetes bacterium]|nr:succinate dehydrogenase flavoprotein subunit [Armatimonadota bacterium]